jgi:hypothetical protein
MPGHHHAKGKLKMPLLTQDELNPLQAARRVAEEHIDAIRAVAIARLKTAPYRDDEEAGRYFKIAAVVDALQTIYDNVSELEFEEEQPPEAVEPEPPEDPEEDEPDEEDEDEDED